MIRESTGAGLQMRKESAMPVMVAQREMRAVYHGGSVGQAVSGGIWLLSAALGTWASPRYGIIALFVGGVCIFPLTQLVLRLVGDPASLSLGNPLAQLARQVAFIVPLCLPLIAAATVHNENWYYPAFMIVVGAHYVPFVFLYGMRHYAALAAAMIGGGVVIGIGLPGVFAAGGWLTGLALVLFAIVIRRAAVQEASAHPAPAAG